MNKAEAREILIRELEDYRNKSYQELIGMINQEPIVYEHITANKAFYVIEIEAYWDDKPNGNVRVAGGIDDGGLRAFVPLTEDFIMSPDGHFIGE
jgi:hypothetical protein